MQDALTVLQSAFDWLWHGWAGVHPAIIRFLSVGLLGNLVIVPFCVILSRALQGVLRGRG